MWFLEGRRHISAAEWPAFLAGQEKLLAERSRGEEIRADAVWREGEDKVHVQLCGIDGELIGRQWRSSPGRWTGHSGGRLAYINHRPDDRAGTADESVVVVSAEDVRHAEAVIDEKARRVRFVLPKCTIEFDVKEFHVE